MFGGLSLAKNRSGIENRLPTRLFSQDVLKEIVTQEIFFKNLTAHRVRRFGFEGKLFFQSMICSAKII